MNKFLQQITFVLSLLISMFLSSQIQASTLYVDNTNIGCSDATADSSVTPYCTLAATFSASVDGDTIEIRGLLYNETGLSVTDRNLTIRGVGENRPIINGNNAGQIIGSSNFVLADVTIEFLEFRYGESAGSGGAIYLEQVNLHIDNCSFSHNLAAAGYGGAIYVNNADSLTITNSTFESNEAQGAPGVGGAIFASALVTAEIDQSTFTNNSAVNVGAAVLSVSSNYEISNSVFSDNTGEAISGALYLTGTAPAATGLIENSTFNNNYAGSIGGAVYASSHTLALDSTEFTNNFAATEGGAIITDSPNTFIVQNSTFAGNASPAGGAIKYSPSLSTDTLTIENSDFSENYTTSGAAALYMTQGTLEIADSTFTDNFTPATAATVYAAGIASATLENVDFTNNTAGTIAGPFLSTTDEIIFDNVTLQNNNTSSSMAAGYLTTSSATDYAMTIRNSVVADNTSGSDTGGLALAGGGKIAIVNSTISGNTAKTDGGGLTIASDVDLFNVTLANNAADSDGNGSGQGGGLNSSAGTTRFFNSIIASNTDNGTAPDCIGNIELDHSLLEDTTGCTVGTTNNEITGSDPLLNPLNDNGGNTLTHALLTNSPAVDAGTSTGCLDETGTELTTDQRGYARTGGCDMGSYEAGCGDGITQGEEECDDGNSSNTDTCTGICENAACGDGYLQGDEECDDGNNENDDGCDDSCVEEVVTCGDGTKEASEECDDGNLDDDDGCSSTCTTEEDTSENATSGGGGCQLHTNPNASRSALLFYLMVMISLIVVRQKRRMG